MRNRNRFNCMYREDTVSGDCTHNTLAFENCYQLYDIRDVSKDMSGLS